MNGKEGHGWKWLVQAFFTCLDPVSKTAAASWQKAVGYADADAVLKPLALPAAPDNWSCFLGLRWPPQLEWMGRSASDWQ